MTARNKSIIVLIFLFITIFSFNYNGYCATTKIEISSGSIGGSLHVLGTNLRKLINSTLKGEATATVVSTGGSLENCRLLSHNKTDIGFVITPQAREAYDGVATFKKEKPAKHLRTILTYFYGGLQFIVRADSGIKTMLDLKGKKVTVGGPGSAGTLYNTWAMEAHGFTEKDYDRQTLPYSAGVRAMQDRVIDCFAVFSPAPFGLGMQIAAVHDIRILPFAKTAIEKFCKEHPGFVPGAYKTGCYKSQVNTEEAATVETTISIITREEVDEDLIYKVTKALWDNIEEFRICHQIAKNLVLKEATVGAKIPLHSGALKFYREKGLSIRSDLIP